MKELKYIIVGTGRCGTVYVARLLTSMGIPCGHESIFNYQDIEVALERLNGTKPLTLSGCSQLKFEGNYNRDVGSYLHDLNSIVAESSYMAVPHLNHSCLSNTQVIHVVRHPIKVVNSFLNYLEYFHEPSICPAPNPIYESFIYKHAPVLKKYPAPFERAAMYYVLWNEMIESRTLLGRIKAEDGPRSLLDLLNINQVPSFDDRRINSFEKPGNRFHLGLLPKGEVKDRFVEIGKRYGYNMSSEYLFM
jgi:hypothetical protein